MDGAHRPPGANVTTAMRLAAPSPVSAPRPGSGHSSFRRIGLTEALTAEDGHEAPGMRAPMSRALPGANFMRLP